MNKPTTSAKLIVVVAFEDDGEDGLQPAFEPREYQGEQQAKIEAGSGLHLSGRHCLVANRRSEPRRIRGARGVVQLWAGSRYGVGALID